MQIQKDDIKNKIIEAALEEFLIAGYTQSSMRNIASQAGITVGNIYSYFSSKEDLFENVLEGTVAELKDLVNMSLPDPGSSSTISHMTEAVKSVFLRNRVQFLILMDGAAGSKYENIKDMLIELANERINREVLSKMSVKSIDSLLSESISVAIIEGIINIFKKYGGDEERLEILLIEFLTIIVGDIITRI